MPAAAAAIVITFATSVGASTAVAATVGAIASAAVTGAIVGAAIGAGTALLTGGDVFEGALRGAAIGGITAGVFSGLSMAANAATGGALGSSATTQLGNIGLSATGEALVAPGEATGTGVIGQTVMEHGSPISADVAVGGVPTATSPVTTPATPGIMSQISDSKVAAGIVEGMGAGAGEYLSGKEQVEGAKEIEEFKAATKATEKATNLPGEFEAQTANVLIPNTWARYFDPSAANAHLSVNRGVA
ncbi:hypothetical protein KAR91_83530 [Candidatus Pacearchaeota archaeon]|nr:hypothetical protein [Candidatus Pacearchaeota archaeon]